MTALRVAWQKLTEKSEEVSLFGFLFMLTARRDPSVEGKYDFFIQVWLFSLASLLIWALCQTF